MPKCILINANNQTITETTYEVSSGLQKLIDGHIEVAFQWQNGDVLYVDEEGLYRKVNGFSFRLRRDQPMAGSGVIVGAEREGPHYDGGYTTLDPKMTIALLTPMVRFLQNWRMGV
jgi:hypothetical protein